MAAEYSVTLKKIIQDNGFEVLFMPRPAEELTITSREVHRPGLFLAGYEEYFNADRAQFIGLAETGFLQSLSEQARKEKLRHFLGTKPCLVIITRNLEPAPGFLAEAEAFGVPVVRTAESTSDNMAKMISYLGVELAERITRHGVLVEVAGEGVLILGSSGVGKSETAVELIKRGHRLIADDAVEIRKVSSIINARRIFGMGAVKLTEKIDMVIHLEPWDPEKVYDRLGLEDEYVDIMGVKIPATVVPVKPGRNLAIIIEVAAMNNRQKKMGYNAARELMHGLGMEDFEPEPRELEFWKS